MLILAGDLTEPDYEKALAEVKKFVQESSKAITHEDLWGRRDLSYKLKRQSRGYYAVFHFSADASAISELRGNIKLHPAVLRHLIISVPPDYIPGRYNDILLREEKLPEEKTAQSERKPRLAPRGPEDRRVPGAPLYAAAAAEKPHVAGKQEEEQLKKVEKKLEQILENPDIDIR